MTIGAALRIIGAVMLGIAMWFVCLLVLLLTANQYDGELCYRLNPLGQSSPI